MHTSIHRVDKQGPTVSQENYIQYPGINHKEEVIYIYIYIYIYKTKWASLVAQLVKNPPVIQETWVRSLGWEDPLEKGKATHSSILAWRIPWTV